jgi:hypothetical protein
MVQLTVIDGIKFTSSPHPLWNSRQIVLQRVAYEIQQYLRFRTI